MPNHVVELVYWVEEGESPTEKQKFILEKGDCDLA
jgi:hypothetical protein